MKIDHPIHLLVTTATMASSDEALIISATMSLQADHEVLFGHCTWCQFRKVAHGRISSPG
jgi:hypothetical protein